MSKLYKDYYLEWCREKNIQPVTEDRYRRTFCGEYNIGFKLPKSDTCKTCDMIKVQLENPNATEDDTRENKLKLELHQRRAEVMQTSLKNEIENAKLTGDICVITFDLQQALPVPNLTVGPAFYLRKSWVYNLGVHDCLTGQGFMYMWPENVAKRGSDEIASIMYKHFKENRPKPRQKLVVYTDNCGGQNKNWSIICLWQQLVNEGWFQSIEHRFLVAGHTHLPSDRDFAIIEKYKKHMRQVYEPKEWYEAVEKSKRKNPFIVRVLTQQDILCFSALLRQIVKKQYTDDKEKLSFSKIISFKFSQEDRNKVFIKHFFNQPFKPVTIKKRGIRNNISIGLKDLQKKYDRPISLNQKKKFQILPSF